jgi:hypothetical protein
MDYLRGTHIHAMLPLLYNSLTNLCLDFGVDDIRPYLSHLSSAHKLYSDANSFVSSITSRFPTKTPDLTSIALLIIALFISLKVLGMLYRAVMFWIHLAFRVAFYVGLGMTGVWIYTRGAEGALEDVSYWKGYWQGEYQRWNKNQRIVNAAGFGGAGRQQGFWDAIF